MFYSNHCIDLFVFTTITDSVLNIRGLGWRKPPHLVKAESLCDFLTTIFLKRFRTEAECWQIDLEGYTLVNCHAGQSPIQSTFVAMRSPSRVPIPSLSL